MGWNLPELMWSTWDPGAACHSLHSTPAQQFRSRSHLDMTRAHRSDMPLGSAAGIFHYSHVPALDRIGAFH